MVRALILAAGKGRRMGNKPKALLKFHGKTFLEHIVLACKQGGCESVLVVTAEGMDEIKELSLSLDAEVALNSTPELGMFSSVLVGLKSLFNHFEKTEAVLIHPVDHPLVSPGTITKLIKSSYEKDVVKPVFNNRGGHPIIINASIAQALLMLSPSLKLRDGLASCSAEIHPINVNDSGVLKNLNTPEDLS